MPRPAREGDEEPQGLRPPPPLPLPLPLNLNDTTSASAALLDSRFLACHCDLLSLCADCDRQLARLARPEHANANANADSPSPPPVAAAASTLTVTVTAPLLPPSPGSDPQSWRRDCHVALRSAVPGVDFDDNLAVPSTQPMSALTDPGAGPQRLPPSSQSPPPQQLTHADAIDQPPSMTLEKQLFGDDALPAEPPRDPPRQSPDASAATTAVAEPNDIPPPPPPEAEVSAPVKTETQEETGSKMEVSTPAISELSVPDQEPNAPPAPAANAKDSLPSVQDTPVEVATATATATASTNGIGPIAGETTMPTDPIAPGEAQNHTDNAPSQPVESLDQTAPLTGPLLSTAEPTLDAQPLVDMNAATAALLPPIDFQGAAGFEVPNGIFPDGMMMMGDPNASLPLNGDLALAGLATNDPMSEMPMDLDPEAHTREVKKSGFAKLIFEDGEYFMRTYNIEIGRDTMAWRAEMRRDKRAKKHAERVPKTPRRRTSDAASQSYVSECGGIVGYDQEQLSLMRSQKSHSPSSWSHFPSQSGTLSQADTWTDYQTLAMRSIYQDPAVVKPTDLSQEHPDPWQCPVLPIHPPKVLRGTRSGWKGISRRHAKISYNFDENHFELTVIGMNGAFVDGEHYSRDETVALHHKTDIQIGGVSITFILPEMAMEDTEVDAQSEHSSTGSYSGKMSFSFENGQGESIVMENESDSDSNRALSLHDISQWELENGYDSDDLVDHDSDDDDEDEPSPPRKQTVKLKVRLKQPSKKPEPISKLKDKKLKHHRSSHSISKPEVKHQSKAERRDASKHPSKQPSKQPPKEKEKEKERERERAKEKEREREREREKEKERKREEKAKAKEEAAAAKEKERQEKEKEKEREREREKEIEAKIEQLATLSPLVDQMVDQPTQSIENGSPGDANASSKGDTSAELKAIVATDPTSGRQLPPEEAARLGIDPTTLFTRKKGPGRPPKDGIMSKREKAIFVRQKKEAEKAIKMGLDPSQLPPIETKIKATPRPRTASDAAAGEDGKDGSRELSSAHPDAEKKVVKPARPPRSPSPEMKESDYTDEQLQRPASNYVVLIHEAISNHPNKAMTLQQIYSAIERRYPYYKFRTSTTGWQSSVRHNLGGNDAFVKKEKDGKGWVWSINPDVSIEKDRGKKRAPTPPQHPPHQHPQYPFYHPNMPPYGPPGGIPPNGYKGPYGGHPNQHPFPGPPRPPIPGVRLPSSLKDSAQSQTPMAGPKPPTYASPYRSPYDASGAPQMGQPPNVGPGGPPRPPYSPYGPPPPQQHASPYGAPPRQSHTPPTNPPRPSNTPPGAPTAHGPQSAGVPSQPAHPREPPQLSPELHSTLQTFRKTYIENFSKAGDSGKAEADVTEAINRIFHPEKCSTTPMATGVARLVDSLWTLIRNHIYRRPPFTHHSAPARPMDSTSGAGHHPIIPHGPNPNQPPPPSAHAPTVNKPPNLPAATAASGPALPKTMNANPQAPGQPPSVPTAQPQSQQPAPAGPKTATGNMANQSAATQPPGQVQSSTVSDPLPQNGPQQPTAAAPSVPADQSTPAAPTPLVQAAAALLQQTHRNSPKPPDVEPLTPPAGRVATPKLNNAQQVGPPPSALASALSDAQVPPPAPPPAPTEPPAPAIESTTASIPPSDPMVGVVKGDIAVVDTKKRALEDQHTGEDEQQNKKAKIEEPSSTADTSTT